MKKISILLFALLLATVAAQAQNVSVVYTGDTAVVTADGIANQYLTITQSGAHVSIAQSSDLGTEITYNLSGTSTDGGFYMSGSYKATIVTIPAGQGLWTFGSGFKLIIPAPAL